MTGLRTSAGIDRKRIQDLDGSFLNYLDLQIEGYVKKEQVVKNEFGNWTLKPHTYFFADGIAADLFFTDSTTEKP
jgi:hypothetical protein